MSNAQDLDSHAYRAAYSGWKEGQTPPTTIAELFSQCFDPDDWNQRLIGVLRAVHDSLPEQRNDLLADPLIADITIYSGSVSAKSDFTFNSHVLVLGDLNVDGVITGEPEHAILMVAGNVQCKGMNLLRSYLFIDGSVTASAAFHGCCDGFAQITGVLRTKLYICEHWTTTCVTEDGTSGENARIEAEYFLDTRSKSYQEAYPSRFINSTPDAILTPQALGDGALEPVELMNRIARGENIFR